MVKIKKMKVKFNKKLYTKEAIDLAISAYDSLARFFVFDQEDYWVVEIKGKGEVEEELLKAEFSNFVLANVKNNL